MQMETSTVQPPAGSEVARLQKQLQELITKVEEEAKVREALHRAIADGDPIFIIAAGEAAKGSLGKAETAWAEQAVQQAERSLQDAHRIADTEAAQKIKAIMGRAYPSTDGLVPKGDLKRFVYSMNFAGGPTAFEEKHLDMLMDEFSRQQGVESSDDMVCYKAFIDFLFQSESRSNQRDQRSYSCDAHNSKSPLMESMFNNLMESNSGKILAKLRAIFNMCDCGRKDGKIDKRELIMVCNSNKAVADFFKLPQNFNQKDGSRHALEVFFQSLDINDDHFISFQEFKNFYLEKVSGSAQKKTMSKAFTEDLQNHFDLVVVGAGPVGVKAAVVCANRGFRVGLMDPKGEAITGAPTGAHSKCLREAALQGAKTWEEVERTLNLGMQRAKEATSKLLDTFHVEQLPGWGSFLDHEKVLFQPVHEGESRTITAECFVIATGSRARRTDKIPFDLPGVFDSDTISSINYIPKIMVVFGGGLIALEYAVIFSLLGSRVIVIHRSGKMMKKLDEDLQDAILENVKQSNVEVMLNTKIHGVELVTGSESPSLVVDTGDARLECDCILAAHGRIAVSDGLGLEKLEHLGMKLDNEGFIVVDKGHHTGVGNIYAVGDVAGGGLATRGQAQAAKVIQIFFGMSDEEHVLNSLEKKTKFGAWTVPEVAWVGMSEMKAKQRGIDADSACVDYAETIRGEITGDKGFMKIVFDRKDGKVLGVHVCGDSSCDLIVYGAELVDNEETVTDVLNDIFPAVTYHELYNIAAYKAKIMLSNDQLRVEPDFEGLCAATAWNRLKVAFQGSDLTEEGLREIFQMFDVDKSGSLTVDELVLVTKQLGLDVSIDVAREMVYQVDTIMEDGEICFNELRHIVLGIQSPDNGDNGKYS